MSRQLVNENHPNFDGFIRAFWRRIEPYKAQYGKELPDTLPVEFLAAMGTAMMLLTDDGNANEKK